MTTEMQDTPGVEYAIDQLWYTSSSFGLRGNLGFQVRAASRGLLDKDSFRFERISGLLYYYLPQGSTPYDTKPEEAPVCMLFTQLGGEKLLAHKVYAGKDPIGRPGNFFVHLLAGLPHEFSTRQAISLWGALDFWRRSEGDFERDALELDPVPYSTLARPNKQLFSPDHPGVFACPLGNFGDYLAYAIRAYLSLGAGQSLFIAAPPDTVAALIMGIVEALPDQLLNNATFSTYEQDVIHISNTTIVGTCVLDNTQAFDLPAACDGEAGRMLNCYSGKRSELPQSGALTGYAQFAAHCLVSGNNEELHAFLEQGGIVDLLSLMSIFKLYQLHRQGIDGLELSGQDISYLLNSPGLARSYLAGEKAPLVYEAILDLALDDAGWYKVGQPSLTTLRQQAESDHSLKSSLNGLAQHALLAFDQAWTTSDVPAMSRLLDGVIATLDVSLALAIWQHIFSTCVSRGPSRLYSVDQWLWFLQGWARLPEAMGDQQTIVRELLPWLHLPWPALGEFLKLSVPERWRKQAVYYAIQRAGSGSVDEQPISEVVAQNQKLFEEVFEHYASSGPEIRASIRIFAKLVDLHYEGKMPLLMALLQGLVTRGAQKLDDRELQYWTRNLLNNARLSPAELSELLESDMGQLLQSLLPPPIYNEYLRKYLAELGPQDLQRTRCLSMLGRLDPSGGSRNGEPLSPIEGWRAVADVLQGARTIVQKRREKDLVYAARFLPKIIRPEAQRQTHDALIAALVRAVTTKDDVVWIMRQAGRGMGGESQLLADMIVAAEAGASDGKHYVSTMLTYLEVACSVELSEPARSHVETLIQNMPQPLFNELEQRAEKGWSQHVVRQLTSERKRLRRSLTGFSTFLKKH